MKYDHKKIEKKWQKIWAKGNFKLWKAKDSQSSAKATAGKPKKYVLDMFPYPSGEGLHVGHLLGYVGSDILSRYFRMRGYNVLHPMGWDAFGLPAENYAIKNKIHPEVAVKRNVKNFKRQLQLPGFSYDWSREINTTDPEYYKWTQWIFLQLYKKGLAYEAELPVNWCPSDKTVLANEEVVDGCCDRCGAKVERKKLRQWVLKITAYADRLINDLELLEWPQKVKELQKNWIGRSEGALIAFEIKSKNEKIKNKVEVFTTRPDTLAGATYMVVAPEHELVMSLASDIQNRDEVEKYIAYARNRSDLERQENKEKTGIELKGIKAINPLTKEEIPVWISDYVLGNYGTGAIMAVPAHDERDFAFAKKFNLPIKEVVLPYFGNKLHPLKQGLPIISRDCVSCILRNPKTDEYAYLEWNEDCGWTTLVGGGIEKGEDVAQAGVRELKEETGYINVKFIKEIGQCFSGGYSVQKKENRFAFVTGLVFELVDDARVDIAVEELSKHKVIWVTKDRMGSILNMGSSQYLWDIYCNGKKIYIGDGLMKNSGNFDVMNSEAAKWEIVKAVGGKKTVNYKLRDWIFSRQRYWGEPIPMIKCATCGLVPVPEKDLPVKLPNVKSYEPTGTGESPLAGIEKWVNVKCPNCKGKARRETNTMPQWAGSCWYYLAFTLGGKKLKSKITEKGLKIFNSELTHWSPVDLYIGGIEHAVLHLLYARFWHKVLYDIGVVGTKEPFQKLMNQGLMAGPDGQKMSKSRGNVISPDEMIEKFGADSLRMYEMFMGPFEAAKSWDPHGIVGMYRLLQRIWNVVGKNMQTKASDEKAKRLIHRTVKKMTHDIEHFRFNTAISAVMIVMNEIETAPLAKKELLMLMKAIAPFVPHIAQELASLLGEKKLLDTCLWPTWDESLIVESTFELVIQINGRARDKVIAPQDADEAQVKALALQSAVIKKWIDGKAIQSVIYIKNRLINLIV